MNKHYRDPLTKIKVNTTERFNAQCTSIIFLPTNSCREQKCVLIFRSKMYAMKKKEEKTTMTGANAARALLRYIRHCAFDMLKFENA